MISNNECKRVDAALGRNALHSPKLAQAKAIHRLEKALGEELEKMVSYGAVRGETLTWYFTHPAALMKWNYVREEVIERMRQIYREEKMGKLLRFRRVTAKVLPVRIEREAPEPPREEKALGEFPLPSTLPPQLRRSFERIAEHIKAHHEETKRRRDDD